MKKSAKFCLPVLFAVTLSAQDRFSPPGGRRGPDPGFGVMFAGPGSRTPVTGAPYSGVQTSQFQQTLANGNQINRQEQSKVYRDGQGRVRIEHAPSGPAASTGEMPQARVTIFDPVAGHSYVLSPAAMTAVKIPVHNGPRMDASEGPRGGHMRDKGRQVETENLGSRTINGMLATGTRSTETIPAGAIGNQQAIQIVRETWISTELKVPVLINTSDPRYGNTTMQLRNVVLAEPDSSLFQVPSSYTLNEPSRGGRGAPSSN